MKNTFVLLFLITLSFQSFGQISTEKELHGKWKVEEIVKESLDPQYLPIIEGFQNSIFYFNENNSFEFTTTSAIIAEIIEMTEGNQWKFEPNGQFVDTGTEANGYNIMRILIRKVDGKIIFHLDETPIRLEMKKIE